jgi:hypothetical protein
MRLKLKYDEPLSSCAFNFNVRPCMEALLKLKAGLGRGRARQQVESDQAFESRVERVSKAVLKAPGFFA